MKLSGEAKGIDVSDHLSEPTESRFFEQVIDLNKPPREFLRDRFNKKFKDLERRTKESDQLKRVPDKEMLWQKLLRVFKEGFQCPYCNERMMIKDPVKPYRYSFSLDHKVSEDRGGDNSLDNLQFICHGCNIVKGATDPETFEKLTEDEDLLRSLKFEGWSSRLADKLDRKEARV